MARRLSDEWRSMSHRPSVLRQVRMWGLDIEVSSLDDLVAAAGLRPRGAEPGTETPEALAAADALLARLVVIARDDDLAGRVVLQRLLPGLCSAARRWTADRPGGSADALDELVSAAWLVIRTFPVERRPGRLAAKLLRDAEHQAFVKATRRKWRTEAAAPSDLDRVAADSWRREPLEELLEVVELARPALSDHDLHLLGLLASGRTIPEVAAALQVSVRTVGYHREAMVYRVRNAVGA